MTDPTALAASTAPMAAQLGAGALGFALVMLLIIASAGLMWAMAGSMRRMRNRVSRGEFGQQQRGRRGRQQQRGTDDDRDGGDGSER